MIKANKYLVVFATVFSLLTVGVTLASHKFLPLLFQHTVHYCQTLVSSFSMRIPNNFGLLLTGLLIFMFIISFMKFFLTYVKVQSVRKKLVSQIKSQPRFTRLLKKLELEGKAFLVESNKPFAFCFGIRHPKIYLSTALVKLMNSKELEAILIHEKYHLEHRDGFIMLFATTTKSLFPFFPLFRDLIKNYQIEREIQADRAAIQRSGTSQSLVSVLKKLLLCKPVYDMAFVAAMADPDTLELRIKALIGTKLPSKGYSKFNTLLSILSLTVLAALVVAPVQAVELHDQENDVLMVCLQNGECSTWCKENSTIEPYTPAPNASYLFTPAQ